MPTPRILAIAMTVAALTAFTPVAASAQDTDDPGLDQTIDPGQRVVHGAHVIDTGHADLGPKFDGANWRLLIHDDAHKADANASSVWRYPDETVLRVLDAAQQTVPDDDAYDFIGAQAGQPVWVVPQTQNPGVVWMGWNTQDPAVMRRIDRGVTLSLTGVQGPGTLTVYLQSGSFGAPQVLWDSRKAAAQPVWVDVNTHTHANWVFTKPGVYLVRLRVDAGLVDGKKAGDTRLVRFAVGTATPTGDALAAQWRGAPDPGAGTGRPANQPAAARQAAEASTSDPLVPVLIAAIAVVAVVLVAGFGIVVVRGNRARRRVLAATPPGADDAGQ